MAIYHDPAYTGTMPSAIHARKVTFGDALQMKQKAGEWFRVPHSRTAKNGASVMAYRLRQDLPRWYGGRWEVQSRDGLVHARFLGDPLSVKP